MDDLTLRSLQGKSLAEKLEIAGRWAGADGRVMDGIWATESGRGQNMRSGAGAMGHFQLMEPTRATWSERLGFNIDPDNFDHALIAGAHTLRENLRRFGNLPDALRAYNAGWDRSRWNNPETAAYVGKVLGGNADAPLGGGASPVSAEPVAPVAAEAVLGGQVTSGGSSAGVRPEDVLSGAATAPAAPSAPSGDTERFIQRLGGFRPFNDPDAVSLTGMLEVNAEQTGAVVEQTREDSITGMDRFSAAVRLNTITGNLIDAIDQQIPARDPDFDYEANMEELEEGRTERQRIELQERATSRAHAEQIIERQDREIALREVAGDNLVVNLGAGLIDPAGFLLGGGIGKVLQGTGTGARVLFSQNRNLAASASMVGEGVAGNIIGTGIIDRIAGSYQAPEDYAVNGLFGALLGTAAIPIVSRSVTRNPLTQAADDYVAAVNEEEAGILVEAIDRAGPAASVENIQATADTIRGERVAAIVNDSFSAVPEENRLFSIEEEGSIDVAAMAARATEQGLDSISDPTLRSLADNLVFNSDRIIANNPIEAIRGDTGIMRNVPIVGNLASTGETLLLQNDNVAKAVGLVLTEGTTGRGGRRHSAALTAALNERRFMRPILAYEDNFHIYRQSRGQGWMQFAFGDGALRQQFDIEVAAEMRARARPDLYASTAPASVRQAADYMADGYRLMGEEQVRAGTLGSQNIRPGDPSYFPQHVSSAKLQRIAKLDADEKTQRRQSAFRSIISEQARTIFGWDKEFSDFFGVRYLETAMDRAAGNYDVPVNLTHQSAGGFVNDLLETMREGATKAQAAKLEKASQKFARGGAGFTRGRLNFDVMDKVKLDDGSEIRLLDIMDTDMVGMYRSYARRASGEIALQQYGIAGAHGLKSIRKYLEVQHLAGRITNDGMAAFDQISAEFLNTPFGKHQGSHMDNLRIITSTIKLGGMGITQFGEYGNGIAALGWGRVLTAVKDIPRLMGEIGTIRKGGEVHGLLSSIEKQQGFETGMDSFILTRALDVKDNDVQMYGREGLGLGTRVIRGASHAQAILSGHRMITAVQVRGLSEQVIRKAFRYIRDDLESKALDDMGFSPELRAALKRNMGKIADFSDGPPKGMVRLYRGETALKRADNIPDYVKESDEYRSTVEATGRWFTDSKAEALHYTTKQGEGVGITYIDVPKADLDKYRVSNIPSAKKFSARPEEEFFVSRELADQRSPYKEGTGEIGKLDIFAGDLTPAQRAELVGVINRGSNQIIQNTYIGETGKWAHDGFLKLLFQFRTFSLTAVEKQWGRNLRNYGALKSMMFLMGAMSFAAPVHMARVHARMLGMSEEDREAYAEKYLAPAAIAQATMTYASAAGFAGDIWDIGGSATTNIMGDAAPEWLSGTVNPRGGARSQGKFLGGVVAPSASIAEDAFALANGDWKKLKRLLPGANLPYMVPMINAIEEATTED